MTVLYDNDEEIVGDVEYNQKLDFWSGANYQNGGIGLHLGFGKTRDGEFYLIFGSDWQGQKDRAEIVPAEEIVKEAIKSGNLNEIEDYPELMKIYEKDFNQKEIETFSKTFSVRINIRENDTDTKKKIDELLTKIRKYKNLE